MVQKDFYGILELTEGASREEIDEAYRKLSLRFHPHRNKDLNAETEFVQVAEAYDTLSDAERKAIFDKFGFQGLSQGAPNSTGGYTEPYVFHGDAFKVFQTFFGTESPFQDLFPKPDEFGLTTQHDDESQRTRKKQDSPFERELLLTLEEVYLGCVKKMKMSRRVLSEDGYTTTVRDKIFTIPVAHGWKEGTRITFPKEGDQGSNSIPSDVIFIIKYKPHPRFRREGNNLVHTCNLSLSDALTGCILELVTLDGRKLSIPVNDIVRPGYELTVPNEGVILKDGTRGNLIVRFDIGFPKSLTEEKKAMIRQALA